MLKTKLQKLGYEFVVKIYASKTYYFDDANFIGQCRIAWNKCYELPRQTAVFDQFELSDPHKIAEVSPVQGRIAVQAKYMPIDINRKYDDDDLDEVQKLEQEESEEEPDPVHIGDIRVSVSDTRMFEPDLRHKLRFSIEGQDEVQITKAVEGTKRPKWSEKFVFPVFSPRKDDDFPMIIVDDMDDKKDDKVLHTVKVEFGKLTEKPSNKLEKWCAFFNKSKKQVKLAIFYRQLAK